MNKSYIEIFDRNGSLVVSYMDRENSMGSVLNVINEKYSCIDPVGLLNYCITPRSRSEINEFLRFCGCNKSFNDYMKPLLAAGLIKQTRPHAPQSRLQQFYTDRTML